MLESVGLSHATELKNTPLLYNRASIARGRRVASALRLEIVREI